MPFPSRILSLMTLGLALLLGGCSDNDRATPTVSPTADLALTVGATTATPEVGSEVTVTFTVENTGPDTASSVIARVQPPTEGLALLSASASQGHYDTGTATWSVGALTAGARASLTLRSRADAPGSHVIDASVQAATPTDPRTDNNRTSLTLTATETEPVPVQARLSGIIFKMPRATTSASLASPTAATDAQVQAHIVGRNDTPVTIGSDVDGRFSLSAIEALAGQRLVVRVTADGYAPFVDSFVLHSNTAIDLGAVMLHAADPMECVSGTCRSGDGRLRIDGLSPDLSVIARHFNPETHTRAFPGDFGDDLGNLLFSGAFASLEVSRDGARVSTLEAPVQLWMSLPRDTWTLVQNIEPGSGRIVVPWYHFDEDRGLWRREGQADLVDHTGTPLPETALAEIRSGRHHGVLYAKGAVSHFSTWNIDWPVSTRSRVRGRVVDGDGEPVANATIHGRRNHPPAQDITVPTGEDGTFDFITLRSEQPGEDLSLNGIEGETSEVSLTVKAGDDVVDGGTHAMPSQDDEEKEVEIRFENPVQVRPVRIQGKVVQKDGTAAGGASVTVWTPETALCANECRTQVTADQDGNFDVTTLTTGNNPVIAQGHQELQGVADGSRVLATGSQPIDPEAESPELVLDSKSMFYRLQATIDGNVIRWLPSPEENIDFGIPDGAPVCEVRVTGGSGRPDFNQLKWHLFWYGAPIYPPVTYGQLPDNVTPLLHPPLGALSPEDEIFVGCDLGYPDAAGTIQVPSTRSTGVAM